jgi:hypothetical protein
VWCVFWDNGNASDLLTTAGVTSTLGGEVGHCAFFGNLTRDYISWSGGVVAQSVSDNVHDCIFAADSRSMQIAAPVTIQQVGGTQAPQLPDSATAAITNCRGVWANPAVSLLNGRVATQTGISIRQLRPGEHVPTLLDFLGTRDDASTANLLRKNLHSARYSAQVIIGWINRSLPK